MSATPSFPTGEIVCFGDCGETMWFVSNWPFAVGAPFLVLVIGGLIVERWVDLWLVATVGFVALALSGLLEHFELHGTVSIEPLTSDGVGAPLLVYAICLSVAAFVYAAKRFFQRAFHSGRTRDREIN